MQACSLSLLNPHRTSLLLYAGMQLALQAGEERADAVLEAYTCCVDLLTGNSSAAIQHPSECSLYQADEQPLTA